MPLHKNSQDSQFFLSSLSSIRSIQSLKSFSNDDFGFIKCDLLQRDGYFNFSCLRRQTRLQAIFIVPSCVKWWSKRYAKMGIYQPHWHCPVVSGQICVTGYPAWRQLIDDEKKRNKKRYTKNPLPMMTPSWKKVERSIHV